MNFSNIKISYLNLPGQISIVNKNIKKDDDSCGTNLPKKLDDNTFILVLKDILTKEIISLLWYGNYYSDSIGNFTNINFTYTFKKFRQKGFNKFLRIKLEEICIGNGIEIITSTPFEDSPSKNILEKIGYVKNLNYYWKKLILIK